MNKKKNSIIGKYELLFVVITAVSCITGGIADVTISPIVGLLVSVLGLGTATYVYFRGESKK